MSDPKKTTPPAAAGGKDPAVCTTADCKPVTPMPVLEIVDRRTGTVVSGTTQTVIVGQKMKLHVRTRPTESMSDIQWIVPGERVKDYSPSEHTAKPIPLDAGDLQDANLDFNWIAGGTETVQVAATVRGSRLAAQVTHHVLAPTAVSMTSQTGDVGVGATGIAGDPPMNLYYGTHAKVGIRWVCKATAPAGGDGEIAATQLVNDIRKRTYNAGNSESRISGEFMLDSTVPYDPAVPITAGASATWSSNDNPSSPLTSDFAKKSANPSYRTYFMYKPDGTDSIWVTLMKLEWHWAGETTRVGAPADPGNNWTPVSGASSDRNPSGAASTELPPWRGNDKDVGWR